ncbi:BBE domain-containing protein [Streptomyces europaeiscabiei]|uniref:BBE domain-containing protein n=1 Tax=Streptomyces TaxID=1883 RepID=UPI000A36599D|nr:MULTISPECIES: BBE domain-containing protein [Streptomyces]
MSAAEELCPSGDARAVRLPPHVVTLWHEWRLRAVKAAWDPDNLLRFNKNIPPATAG